METLKDWVEAPESRLKPLDLRQLSKQISALLEADERVERFAFEHPLSVVLVKLADCQVRLMSVDTHDQETLRALTGRLDDWYDAYGIVAFSLKQAYDKQSILVEHLDGAHFDPTTAPIPEADAQWDLQLPLSLYQLPVEVIEVHN